MRVLGTVGLPGSGKGELAAVARDEDIPVVTMGDVIRQACRDRGVDPAENHGRIARALREEDGPAAIAKRSLPHIRAALAESDVDTVVVDGIRSMTEADRFTDAFGDDFVIVSIEAPFDQRAERLSDRGRDGSDSDREQLRAREQRELEFGMGEVIEQADYRIENTASLAAFRQQIRTLLEAAGTGATTENGRPSGSPQDHTEIQ